MLYLLTLLFTPNEIDVVLEGRNGGRGAFVIFKYDVRQTFVFAVLARLDILEHIFPIYFVYSCLLAPHHLACIMAILDGF